jgi:DNA-binding MarR family transcriptional regulator
VKPINDSPRNARRRPRFDSLEQEAYLNLWRTYDRLRAEEDALFARVDLTAQQYNALRLLRGEYPHAVPTLALASRLVSRAPDITRLVDKLVKRGLAARRRLDARVVEVRIAPAGLELLSQLDEQVRECHKRQLGHLNRDQLADLIHLLKAARRPHEAPTGPWSKE